MKYPPNDPAASDPVMFITEPWTAPNGTQWNWLPIDTSGKWIPYVDTTTTFAELTDKATADLPAINGPLATALDGKQPYTYSDTAPVGVADGHEWTNSANGQTYKRIDGQWVSMSAPTAPTWDDVSGKPVTFDTTAAKVTDATTVGRSLLTVANPSEITFPRINADNTVTLQTASAHLDALGASAGGKTILTGATVDQAAAVTALTRKITTGDVSRSSANTGITYTDDPTLVFELDASSWYLVEFALLFTCTSNSGIKFQFTCPTLATSGNNSFLGRYFWFNTGGDISNSGGNTIVVVGATSSRNSACISGYFRIRIGGSGGNLALQWAQNALHADNTTLLAGSLVTVTKL